MFCMPYHSECAVCLYYINPHIPFVCDNNNELMIPTTPVQIALLYISLEFDFAVSISIRISISNSTRSPILQTNNILSAFFFLSYYSLWIQNFRSSSSSSIAVRSEHDNNHIHHHHQKQHIYFSYSDCFWIELTTIQSPRCKCRPKTVAAIASDFTKGT